MSKSRQKEQERLQRRVRLQAYERARTRMEGKIPWPVKEITEDYAHLRLQNQNIVGIIVADARSFDRFVGKGELSTLFHPTSDGRAQEQGILGFFRFGSEAVVVYCPEAAQLRADDARLERDPGRQA